MSFLDELLAASTLGKRSMSHDTPATTATPATNEAPCGFAGDSGTCDTLRHSATPPADVANVATCRKPENTPQSLYSCGLSQMSRMSQGYEATNTKTDPAVRELLAAAMRACDAHGDDEAARVAMRADVHATPPELRDDLLAYFIGTYGPPAPAQAPAPTSAPKPQADPVWKGLHATYMQHVSTCATCRAAGRGYGLRCGAGTALWAAYINATTTEERPS